MNQLRNFLKLSFLVATLVVVPHSLASELTVPNQFSSGDVTSAGDMNANFAAIESSVNDNNARIAALEAQSGSGQSRPVFQGFSAGTVTGGDGLRTMQLVCDAFVQGSHICTDTEFAKSPYNASVQISPGTRAWILREVANVSLAGDDGSEGVAVGSPLSLTNTAFHNATSLTYETGSCRGWSLALASYKGYTVSNLGQIGTSSCSESHRVACCK